MYDRYNLFPRHLKHPLEYLPRFYSLSTYAEMCECDYRCLLRNIAAGNIQPQAVLSTGEYLFTGQRLAQDKQITSPLCRTKRF
jgi:hypothetical protein